MKHTWKTWRVEDIKCQRCGCLTPSRGSQTKYCKPCSDALIIERRQPYYKRHREEILGYYKRLRETRIVTIINGKPQAFWVIKRPYPKDNDCELCHKIGRKLVYHHWGDIIPNQFLTGIWCCKKCHAYIEIVEHPEGFNITVNLYKHLKDEVNAAVYAT